MMEVFTRITIADELAYLPEGRKLSLIGQIEEEARIINNLANSLRDNGPRKW